MIRKIVLSLITMLSFCSLALAQNKQINGTVTDEQGEPLLGVTVVVEGTSSGTTTNLDGQFSLVAPANATLSISFLGYETQKVNVAGKTNIDVTLREESTAIEEVVVMGYGSGKKIGSVIGSVDRVKSEKLENRPSNNVVDALQGQVAGMSVMTGNGELNTTSSVRIHGLGSMNASASPLVLLDGAPILFSTLMAMNQNDIASISVLKDASATSIYGARAANGVIFVTTKNGRRGSESVDVTLRAQYAMSSPVTPRMTAMDTEQFLGYAARASIGRDIVNKGLKLDIENESTIKIYRSRWMREHNLKENELVNTNWWKEILNHNAPMYQIDLSVSGGSDKTSYYFSGNYADQDGILPGSELTRYTFRANVDTKATNWLRMGMSLGLGYQENSVADTNDTTGQLYISSPVMATMITPSYQPLYDKDGNMITLFESTRAINPRLVHEYMPRGSNRLQMNGAAFIELTPVRGLTVRSSLSADAYDSRSFDDASPLTPEVSGGVFGSGSVIEAFSRYYAWTWTNTAEYKHTWKDVHNFTALLGEETLYDSSQSFGVTSIGITSSKYLYLPLGTDTSGVPSYSLGKSAFNSVFGRIEYDYDNRYFANVVLRNDASSRFGENNRNALFWSVGAMWSIKQEAFLRDNQTISDLNFKVSYGTQGNAGIGNYAHQRYLSYGSAYGGATSWMLASIGNPDLTWESQSTLNIAASIQLWRKLTLDVEYYRRDTDDMLMAIPLAPSSGFSSKPGNVGSMRNSGIDLSLNYDIYASRDWYVNFHATFNYNKNQLTRLWDPSLTDVSMGNGLTTYAKGQPFPTWQIQEWRGVDAQTGLDTWTKIGGGVTSNWNEAELVTLNSSQFAPYTGGFGVTASWKGLMLTADFAWVHGNYLYNNMLYFLANPEIVTGSGFNQCELAWDYWREGNTENARYPRLDSPNQIQFDSRMLELASFLRLKNLQLSYALPSHIMAKTKFIKGLKVWVGARNLWTVTGYSGLDPEAAESGVDVDIYPNTRQINFGLEFKF